MYLNGEIKFGKVVSLEEVSDKLDEALKGHMIKNQSMDEIIAEFAEKYTYRAPIGGEDDEKAKEIIVQMGETYKEKYNLEDEIKKLEQEIEKLEQEKAKAQSDLENVETAIIKAESNEADLLGEMRERVGETGRFIYVIILGIMIFEVILLLILYYKRLFMLAILITIFPLVTVAYVFERSRGENAKIIKTWIQEYTTNVFIQTIHAILYVTLVEVGYSVFIDNHDNVIIFILAVTSLITAEPILKNILGMKSSTVTDLSKYGATMGKTVVAATAVASTFRHTKKDLENIDKKAAKKETKIGEKQAKTDSRLDTLRRANENRINKNGKLTEAQKMWKLNKWNKFNATTDKAKESIRKKKEAIRRRQKRAKKVGRVAANASAAFTSIAGGIAAGGDLSDIVTTAGIANAITGTNQEVSGGDDVKVENKVGDVSAETPREPNGYVPRYSGSGYDDYEYGSGNGGYNYSGYRYGANGYNGGGNPYVGGNTEDEESSNSGQTPQIDTPQMSPSLRTLFSNRLEEEKIYVEKKYNEHEENSNL